MVGMNGFWEWDLVGRAAACAMLSHTFSHTLQIPISKCEKCIMENKTLLNMALGSSARFTDWLNHVYSEKQLNWRGEVNVRGPERRVVLPLRYRVCIHRTPVCAVLVDLQEKDARKYCSDTQPCHHCCRRPRFRGKCVGVRALRLSWRSFAEEGQPPTWSHSGVFRKLMLITVFPCGSWEHWKSHHWPRYWNADRAPAWWPPAAWVLPFTLHGQAWSRDAARGFLFYHRQDVFKLCS